MVAFRTFCTICTFCTFLAACTTPSGTFCDIAEQHSFSDEAIAAMSDTEVERELSHNEKGRRLCQWEPRG